MLTAMPEREFADLIGNITLFDVNLVITELPQP